MLKVIIAFNDLQDDGYFYGMGEVYPRRGYTPTPERVKSLMSADNARRVPLIEGIYEEPKTEVTEEKPKLKKKAKTT